MKSNTTMTLPTSTDRTTFEITKDLEKVAYMSMADGSWIANPGKRDEVNTLLYEMNLAQKQQNLQNEGEITKGEKWASATAGSVFEGLQDWDTGVKIAMHKFFSQEVPEYLLTDSVIATDNQRRLEDAGWGMKLLSNVSKATGNMLPTMTIGLVFPQAELKALGKFAKLVKKTTTSTSMFTSSFGNGYKQAINEGRLEDEAVSYALLNAASETAMEQLLGVVGGNKGIKWLGNKAVGNKVAKNLITHIDDVVSAVAKNPAVKKKLYDYASAFGGEFMEEYLQEVMQPVFENIAYSGDEYTFKNNPVRVFSKEAFYNGIVGGIMGDVFESVGMVPKDSAVDTDTDIQIKTDTNTNPSAKVKSKSDSQFSNLFDSVTRKTLEQLSEADAMAADEAVTDAYAEHLKSEGVSSDMAETFKQESAKSRTSKASAIEHILKLRGEYGEAIKAKVEKIVSSGNAQSTDKDIANSDQLSTTLSEKLPITQSKTLDTMTDTEVDTLYKTTIKQYADFLKIDGFTETQIDSYLDEAMKTTGVEDQKSAIMKLQEEMGISQQETLTADETNVFANELNDDRIDTNSTSVYSTNQEVFDALKQTEIFRDSDAIEHVLLGDIKNGQAKGFHYEGMPEPIGRIIPGTESLPDANGVYSGTVEINGIIKQGNKGESTFFPKHWSPQEVVDAINEAYDSREYKSGNTYFGYTKTNIMIHMYLNHDGKIISAYPIYKEGK